MGVCRSEAETKNENSHTTKKEEYEKRIVREYPSNYGMGREVIWEKDLKDYQEKIEEKQETTVMDTIAAVCPELARRLTDIAKLLRW